MSKTKTHVELKPQWFQILLALADRDLHGYAIMNAVLEQTDNRMRLWPGTLYGSLKRLVQEGLIEESTAPPSTDQVERHFYRITRNGVDALAAEAKRLAGFVQMARARQVL